MAIAKRIRCLCGKVYNPVEHACCPACGVEVRVERISVIAPEKRGGSEGTDVPPLTEGPPAPVPVPSRKLLDVRSGWIIGGAVIAAALIFGITQLLKPDPIVQPSAAEDTSQASIKKNSGEDKGENNKDQAREEGKAAERAQWEGPVANSNDAKSEAEPASIGKDNSVAKESTKASAGSTYKGRKHIVEAKGSPETNGKALEAAVASAADGDIVYVHKGQYAIEGLPIERAIHLLGEFEAKSTPPQPIIQSKGRTQASIDVLTKGVTLEKLMVMQEGTFLPALNLTKESETTIASCLFTSKGNIVVSANAATSVVAENCGFGNSSGSYGSAENIVLIGSPVDDKPGLKFKFTNCEFASGACGMRIAVAAAGELERCKFKDIGPPSGGGAMIHVVGSLASVVVNECEFSENRSGIEVQAGSAEFKGGAFTKNGVETDAQSFVTPPLASVSGTGKLSFTGVTFTGNRQSLAAVDGGTLDVVDCRFEDHGVAAKNPNDQTIAHVLCGRGRFADGGAPASITVKATTFTRSGTRVATVMDGAALTMEKCEGRSGAMDIITVGGGAPCAATLKKCQFSGFAGAFVVSAGSSVILEDSELRGNKLGMEVREADTYAELTNVVIAKSELFALAVYDGAEVTVQSCTLEENSYGVQAGLPGKQDSGAIVLLDNCKVLNNQRMNARACPNARIMIKGGLFATGAQPLVYREQGGTIESDPPVVVLAVNNQQQAPSVVPLPPKTTSNGRRSSGSGSRSQSQPRPAPSRQQPAPSPGKVGEVLDVIDRVRRLVR